MGRVAWIRTSGDSTSSLRLYKREMDYLPFQRIVKQAEASSSEWESLREMVDAVVRHRLEEHHGEAERLLTADLPRRLAMMSERSSESECRARVEELFRECYQMAVIRRMVTELAASRAMSAEPASSRPVSADSGARNSSPPPRRRAFREPGGDEIASMIDDMLSGHRS